MMKTKPGKTNASIRPHASRSSYLAQIIQGKKKNNLKCHAMQRKNDLCGRQIVSGQQLAFGVHRDINRRSICIDKQVNGNREDFRKGKAVEQLLPCTHFWTPSNTPGLYRFFEEENTKEEMTY